MSCFCNETAEMATNQPFCSCPQSRNRNVIRSHAFKQLMKKQHQQQQKTIHWRRKAFQKVKRGAATVSDERKRNPKVLWLQPNATSAAAAEWLDRLRLKPHLEPAWMGALQTGQVTPWRHACGQMWMETNVGSFTVTDCLIFPHLRFTKTNNPLSLCQ